MLLPLIPMSPPLPCFVRFLIRDTVCRGTVTARAAARHWRAASPCATRALSP
jgi:hypothetical protein